MLELPAIMHQHLKLHKYITTKRIEIKFYKKKTYNREKKKIRRKAEHRQRINKIKLNKQ